MTQTLKSCRDCRHVLIEDEHRAICLHPAAAEWVPDYLNGSKQLIQPTVGVARAIGKCGREARLWEEEPHAP